MATVRGTRTAARREYDLASGDCTALIRVECHVCGGYGLFGSPSEAAALDYADLIDWHPQCQHTPTTQKEK